MPTLIALAGLPGVGKTSIARALALRTGAVFLRIDAIEAAMLRSRPGAEIGGESYAIACALAVTNLAAGSDVICDCVNPWALTRALFRAAADEAGARFLGVEVLCADRALHRQRLEARHDDLPGFVAADWAAVEARDYHPWPEADLRLDTAAHSAEEAAVRIAARLAPGLSG